MRDMRGRSPIGVKAPRSCQLAWQNRAENVHVHLVLLLCCDSCTIATSKPSYCCVMLSAELTMRE